MKSRPLSGRSCTCFGWITLLSAVETVSSNGELPVTVTVLGHLRQAHLQIDRRHARHADLDLASARSGIPAAPPRPCTCRAARSGNEKSPLSDVVVVRDAAVAVFVGVIVTPGSTAPVWSATRPGDAAAERLRIRQRGQSEHTNRGQRRSKPLRDRHDDLLWVASRGPDAWGEHTTPGRDPRV